jgi:hypothetical protein
MVFDLDRKGFVFIVDRAREILNESRCRKKQRAAQKGLQLNRTTTMHAEVMPGDGDTFDKSCFPFPRVLLDKMMLHLFSRVRS